MDHVANYRVINIIPSNYEGDPHDALGYAWRKLVMRDYKVVREESVPGDDRIGFDKRDAAIAEIAAAHPDVKWVDDQCNIPTGATRVVVINSMWAGGRTRYGYVGGNQISAAMTTVNAGEDAAETAAIIDLRERLALARLDAGNAMHPGWCTKCHSYCYGDCTA